MELHGTVVFSAYVLHMSPPFTAAGMFEMKLGKFLWVESVWSPCWASHLLYNLCTLLCPFFGCCAVYSCVTGQFFSVA
jgi:hypothetical protein